MSHELMHSPDRSPDLQIESDFPPYEQKIWFPAPNNPGHNIVESTSDIIVHTPLSQLFFHRYNSDIGPILKTAGISMDIMQIYRTNYNYVHTEFAHPQPYATALASLDSIYPDFSPPQFVPFEGGRYPAAHLLSSLQARTIPVATRNYETVHDYENHVPVWTVMCPTLFESICQKADNINPANAEAVAGFAISVDKLANLARFGKYIIEMSYDDNRQQMRSFLTDADFTGMEARQLAEASESYRQDVVRPLQQNLRDYFI